MNRSLFIKNIIGAFGVSVLPLHLVKNYQKIYILQCFVRGFRFYKGEKLLKAMKVGDMLELVREPENQYDEFAIALHFNEEKIGFVPMESNEILSRLLDSGAVELQAEITHIEKKAETWENVHIAISLLKESKTPIKTNAAYLTQLVTPEYFSIKYSDDNHISRVYYEDDSDFFTADDFYRDMVENSSNNGVYDLLHHHLTPEILDNAIENGAFITKKQNLPAKWIDDKLIKPIENSILELEEYFNEDGVIALDVERLAKIPDHISDFVSIIDKKGNRFIEVIFKN
ncbi:HIRAN domain-containing protein [Pedobacter sp. SD-b]|uniref:HIRAN domain-containing protein n=1 Tax=Pedobacter segetis TaxID=2793069 RepID=A0ABS1BG64_9SPHI|nr:HIRAN domain-containing protein [Pedobacter segetis]MBK0381837.1 HIRAN domain-containing protein [Pedobacter segetis]